MEKPPSPPFESYLLSVGALVAVLSLVWIVAYGFGYIGWVGRGIGGKVASPVTRNTDLSFKRESTNELGYDLAIGKLLMSPQGLSGIVRLNWRDFVSLNQVDSQTIQIKVVDRNFSIKTGYRYMSLHFSSQEDASRFLKLANQYT